MSLRKNDWDVFAVSVGEHIDGYAVVQYGDKGADLVTDYTADDCIAQIRKYASRAGKNARPGQQRLDLIKIAHFAQLAYDKCAIDS